MDSPFTGCRNHADWRPRLSLSIPVTGAASAAPAARGPGGFGTGIHVENSHGPLVSLSLQEELALTETLPCSFRNLPTHTRAAGVRRAACRPGARRPHAQRGSAVSLLRARMAGVVPGGGGPRPAVATCACVCVCVCAPGRTSHNCHKYTRNLVTIAAETRVVLSWRPLWPPGTVTGTRPASTHRGCPAVRWPLPAPSASFRPSWPQVERACFPFADELAEAGGTRSPGHSGRGHAWSGPVPAARVAQEGGTWGALPAGFGAGAQAHPALWGQEAAAAARHGGSGRRVCTAAPGADRCAVGT